jgi:hypothetical protein
VNIFKVLASSKKGFPEEQASVMLAWLLNPYMEHGLGFTFLKKFLQKIDKNMKIFNQIDTILQPILRSERSREKLKFSSDIEFSVGNSFIDIVLFLNDILISIENKIYSESASNSKQLSLQYTGLKNKYGNDYKIFVVFLVPNIEHQLVKSEYDDLKTNDSDEKIMIEWNSICGIIKEIIDEDRKCITSPINEYLRHTLKAFSAFIDNDFNGYYFETTRNYGEMNPLAKGRKNLDQIKQDANITFVGVNHGIMGLLLLDTDEIKSKCFQYTTESINNYRWINRELFVKICNFILNDNFETLEWIEVIGTVFPSEVIYRIAKNTNVEFYIAIKGGETSLKTMNKETIARKSWYISNNQKTSQWITKDKYLEVLDSKNIFR